MKKVFHFDTPQEQYQSEAAVVWCFDQRFEQVVRKFLKRSGVTHPDSIQVAGGAKSIASPERDSDREFVLDQIRKSVRLHGTKRVMLMTHSDCGAYGGLAQAFKGDNKVETEHHDRELRRASKTLSDAIPGIHVDMYFVDFEGVSQLD